MSDIIVTTPKSEKIMPGAVVTDKSGGPFRGFGGFWIYEDLADAERRAADCNQQESHGQFAPFTARRAELRIIDSGAKSHDGTV